MALVAYRAHPLAKARFSSLPPRTPHPRAVLMGAGLGGCGLVAAIGLRRIWRRGSASSRPRPRQVSLAAKHAIVDAAKVGRRGYRDAPAGERSALNLLASFAATIAVARGVSYVQTQRQPVLPVKKLRQLRHGQARVHHYVPGIALAFTAGSVGLLLEDDRLAPWLAVPYGVGMALTLDEAVLLLELPHSYWTQEHLAAIQAAAALVGAAGLGLRIARRGERAMFSSGPTDDPTAPPPHSS